MSTTHSIAVAENRAVATTGPRRGSLFARLRISHRIGGLVGFATLGLALVTGVYFYGESKIAEIERMAQAYDMLGQESEDMKLGALELRRREKDFLLRKDMKYVDEYRKISDKVKHTVGDLTKMPVAQNVATELSALNSGFDSHRAEFEKAVAMYEKLGLTHETGLQGRLRASVHAAETKLAELKQIELTATMLMLRRHEKDFILREDAKYGADFDKRRGEFDTKLAASSVPDAEKAAIGKLMDAYQADFRALAELTIKAGAEVKQLSKIFSDMQPSFQKVFDFAEKNVKQSHEELAAVRASVRTTILVTVVTILVVFLAGSLWLARGIIRPIAGMTGAMNRLAGGDTATEIPGATRQDEIGAMAMAVQVFKDNMIETENLRVQQAEAEKRAEEEKKAAMNAMADEFEASVRGVVEAVSSAATEMQSSAQSMTATAEETSRQSTAVAAASEQASSNVQTVATAGEELSSSIAEIGRQVTQSTRISAQAVEEAAKTDAKVQGLSEAAQKIGEVVQLINDIAAQTNLLALNATIEAARAGEAGKGFAVVASEVKGLANQTAKATEEIGAQIASIQNATKDSVDAIKSISKTITQVNEIATTIASAVEQQSAATQEIARNVQQAARGTQEVSSNIAGVTQAAGETGSAATQILGAAGDLAKQSETLRIQVDGFVAKVRAA